VSVDDTRPVRRVQRSAHATYDHEAWPFQLPAVRQLLEEGLELPSGVTLLVGENGSGKSTIIEALADAFGLNAEGGSRGAQHATRATESPLGSALQLIRSPGRLVSSYFLRAETMHGLYTYLEAHPSERRVEPRFHEMSHGESFLAILRERFAGYGFFLMDEPEAALSFTSSLGLLALLDDLRREGAQVVIATHSPLVAALPGATVIELGEHGLRRVAYDDLDLLRNWRGFLDAPERYLRHLLD
jgi:predicted ATPase